MTDTTPATEPRRRPEGAVDAAAMSRLFSPRGREEDRLPLEVEAMDIVGGYVLAMDPGVARRRQGG